MKDGDLITWIFKITILTLAAIVLCVVIVMMFGLFDDRVNNEKVFEIIGPAFSTVVGAFVGLLGGLTINGGKSKGCPKDDSK
jgi:uncharacterized membrane protein YfcA